jgi:predicted nucleotidyltransferase
MRLQPNEREVLRSAVLQQLENAQVYLFGSRVDDTKRGGDIDLLIRGSRKLTLIEKARIRAAYFRVFGERRIDLVTVQTDQEDAFTLMILEHAIPL